MVILATKTLASSHPPRPHVWITNKNNSQHAQNAAVFSAWRANHPLLWPIASSPRSRPHAACPHPTPPIRRAGSDLNRPA